jgi:hypothetical protein
VINEGDPVPLAQKEYIKALISVYALSDKDIATKYPDGFKIPDPTLRISGNCVILMDADPEDAKETVVRARGAEAQVVEKKLFGNPFVHLMVEYLERVERLAEAAQITET